MIGSSCRGLPCREARRAARRSPHVAKVLHQRLARAPALHIHRHHRRLALVAQPLVRGFSVRILSRPLVCWTGPHAVAWRTQTCHRTSAVHRGRTFLPWVSRHEQRWVKPVRECRPRAPLCAWLQNWRKHHGELASRAHCRLMTSTGKAVALLFLVGSATSQQAPRARPSLQQRVTFARSHRP